MFGGALHRQQQRQQFVAVGRPGVFAQRLAERDVLGARLGREARGVGRHEGERRLGVAAVLRQVEMHAADQVPGRVQGIEEALEIGLAESATCQARRQFIPSASRTSAVRYSAPAIIGAVSTREASSASVGGGTSGSAPSGVFGWRHSAAM